MKKLTRRTSVVVAGVAAATTVGIAFAAWTTNGTGSGTASSRSSLGLEVTDGSSTETLFPTGKADVKVTIKNLNDYPVQVSSIVADPAKTAAEQITSSDTNCDDSSVSYADQSTGWYFAPNETRTLTLTDALSMGWDADNDCQADVFTVYLKANGASTAVVS